MRALDVIRQKRRFEMFSEKTKGKVLELNSFFGKYLMHLDDRIVKSFTYYDTPNLDLQKSRIVLFKTHIGNFCELNMRAEKISSTSRFVMRTNNKHFTKQIKPHDSLMKHKDFLINSFKEMFLSGIDIDPEFLLQKLKPAYTISTESLEYRSINVTGLKITYSFDKDVYTDMLNNQKVENNVLTIYQHSDSKTDEAFNDLISKLTRYLKELSPTDETKIIIARRRTAEKAAQIKNLQEQMFLKKQEKEKAKKRR